MAKAAKKHKGTGPPSHSKYETSVAPYLDRIASWLERGATAKEVASKLKIGESTIHKYLALGRKGEAPYIDLVECFQRACAEPDDHVEGALYKRACGYQYTEVTVEQKLDKLGTVHALRKEVTRDVPPDPTSAMFWLTNRQPERWQYRKTKEDQEAKEGGGVALIPAVIGEEDKPNE